MMTERENTDALLVRLVRQSNIPRKQADDWIREVLELEESFREAEHMLWNRSADIRKQIDRDYGEAP